MNLKSRLASLFNVNHIIISKVIPYRVSVIDTLFPRFPIPASASIITKFFGFIYSELKHFLYQLFSLKLLPTFLEQLSEHFHPVDGLYERVGLSGGGSELILVISPRLSIKDTFHMLSVPNAELLLSTLLKGEQTVWPELSKVSSRMKLEILFVSILEEMRALQKTYTSHSITVFPEVKGRDRKDRSGSQIFHNKTVKLRTRSSSVH